MRPAPAPRVRCTRCEFAWYGATAAHGLAIVGDCPRCGGELQFLGADEPALVPALSERLRELAPAAVLGLHPRWTR